MQLCCKRVVLNVCGGATGDMYVTRHSRATVGGISRMEDLKMEYKMPNQDLQNL
jgi:hypothetical protein